MVNDYGIEFMIGDTVSFTPTFELYSNNTSHNKGTICGIHGHTIFISVTTYDEGKECELTAIRLSNEITAVLKKAEHQLTLLD